MHIKVSPLPAAILLAVPLWLVACRDGGEAHKAALANITAVDDHNAAANAVRSPDVTNAAHPEAFDPSSEAAKGKAGARAILAGWADALERRDWAAARAAWGHDGNDSGLDPAAFAQAYDRYKEILVEFGDGDVEGGAGSLYYQVPVTFTGMLRDGRQMRMKGTVTLRRVNDVDGSSAADRAWHISMSDLKARP